MNLDLSKINLPLEKQFYLLKHFSFIDEEYESELIKKGKYSSNDIYNLLNTAGSKFNRNFANNPVELWEKILQLAHSADVSIDKKNDKLNISIKLSDKIIDSPIGTNNLISISNLKKSQKTQLYKEKRDNFSVYHLKAKGISTYEITIILSNNPTPQIITIFPGIFAPPFPDYNNQLKKEYDSNNKFWKKHVFLVSNH